MGPAGLPDEFFEYTSDVDETVTGVLESEFRASADDGGIVVLTGDRPGRAYRIDREILIGRSPDSGINIRLPDVSRRHARIRKNGKREYWLEDLASHNGTSVNGDPVVECRLTFGDRITIGKSTMLLFTQHDPIEERLRQRQRVEMLGRLAGGIAHDFNNLLGTVFTNVNYLGQLDEIRTTTNPEISVLIEDLKLAVRRASDLTRKLLVFARPSPYQDRALDLKEVIEETAGMSARAFGSKYHIERHIFGPLLIFGDGAQMHQLLMNLLINARDALPAGGKITITAARRQGESPKSSPGHGALVELSISDEGVGMSGETIARIFEPFFTTKPQGTGLGLSTVARIVREHGGDINVRSTPGRGTTFRIVFPAADATETDSSPRPGGSGSGSDRPVRTATRGLSILLVDDEELQLRSSQRILEQCEHRVIVAHSGEEGLALFEEHRQELDVAMLDIMMPKMSGPELCRAIKRLDPPFRILGVSATSDLARLREMEAAGAGAMLYKPFTPDSLRAALRELFGPDTSEEPMGGQSED